MTRRDRRTLLVGASVVAGLLVFARGVPALRGWTAEQVAASAQATQLLAASSISIAELSAARDTLAARSARLAAIDSVLPRVASASIAVSELASRLEDLADSCRVRVAGIQLRPDSVASVGFVEVSARVNGTTDVAGLAALLHAIAASEQPLAARELTVTAPEPNAPPSKPEALRFDLVVAGLARSEGKARP